MEKAIKESDVIAVICEDCYADCPGTCAEVEKIKALTAVQLEPHEGHWIRHKTPDGGEQYECSRCGVLWEFNDGTPEDNEAYFCPKCGTKMKGVRHESY